MITKAIHTIQDTIFDFQFHPFQSLLATVSIDGIVSLYSYKTNFDVSATATMHSESIRSLEFSQDGSWIYTASLDKAFTILDTETLKPLVRKQKAHSSGLSLIKPLDDYLFATGDDDGLLKIWDLRTKKVARKYSSHVDYVSDIVYHNGMMVSVGGDGLLCVHDPKMKKPVSISDNQDDELLTLQVVKVYGVDVEW
jgi:WD40 repeat protein